MPWIVPAGLFTFPKELTDRMLNRLPALMTEVISQAVEDARRITATTPSAKSGKEGRVETGQMMEAIMGRTFNEGVDRIVGEFGFLDQQQLYFALQTITGFTHLGGEFIKPTLALSVAEMAAVENLVNGLKKVTNG